MSAIRIVGIGGTLRPNSSSAKALKYCLDYATSQGAAVEAFADADLRAPLYEPGQPCDFAGTARMIEALRAADGVIIASPGYHGGVSGALKNILDYTEEMAKDAVPYLDGRAVGCLVSAAGWQAGGATLAALRAIVHALRGWPTPLGVLMNSAEAGFTETGRPGSDELARNLRLMTQQVLDFAVMRGMAAAAGRLGPAA
jgi:FMN reductase